MRRPLESGADAVIAEPSEARVRNIAIWCLLFLVPGLLFYFYYRSAFQGLNNLESMDYAQLGRNLESGRGFITYVLRPLAPRPHEDPMHQPELRLTPLYPLLLAIAFVPLQPRDWVCAWVSGFFYILTAPVIYLLGRRVFNQVTGAVAAGLFVTNPFVMQYALAGLNITLLCFLTALLMLAYHVLLEHGGEEGRECRRPPVLLLSLIAVLCAAMYYTDAICVWIAPVMLACMIWLHRPIRLKSMLIFAGVFLLLVGPWWYRNWLLTGNPIFGLRGAELFMYTNLYPSFSAYRRHPGEFAPGLVAFQAIVRKIIHGWAGIISNFGGLTTLWVIAFFVPSLFFRFSENAANRLRRLSVYALGALLLGSSLFQVQLSLVSLLLPVMLVFGVAFLGFLVNQAGIAGRGIAGVTAAILVVVAMPIASMFYLDERTDEAQMERAGASAAAELIPPLQIVFSDNPWILAWYGNRASVWIPSSNLEVVAMRERFPKLQWLWLTREVRSYSSEWATIYAQFMQQSVLYLRARQSKQKVPPPIAIRGGGHPLLEALNGFTWIQPYTTDYLPTTVLARHVKENELRAVPSAGSGRPANPPPAGAGRS